MANPKWADVEDFIKRHMMEDAGAAIAEIIREVNQELEDIDVDILSDAIFNNF